jgi:hypothetical protein
MEVEGNYETIQQDSQLLDQETNPGTSKRRVYHSTGHSVGYNGKFLEIYALKIRWNSSVSK